MAKQQNTVAKKLRENQKRQKAQEKLAKRRAKGGDTGHSHGGSSSPAPSPYEGYRII